MHTFDFGGEHLAKIFQPGEFGLLNSLKVELAGMPPIGF